MKRFIAIALLVMSAQAYADKENEDFVKIMMHAAKSNGMCGTIRQMAAFQAKVKVPGGTEFFSLFMQSELKRLNVTMNQFSDRCTAAFKAYETVLKDRK